MATWNITNCDDNVRPVTPIHEGDCLCNDGKYIFIPPKTGEKTYEIIYNDGKGDPISTLYTVKYSDCLACNCDKFTFTQTVVSIPSEGCESLTIGTIAGECIKNESALGLYVIPDSIIYPDAYDKNFVTATTEFNSDTNTYDVKVNVSPNEHLSYRRFELKFKIVDANNRTIYNCRRTYEFKQIDMCESLTTPPEAVADKTSVPPMGTVEQRTVMIDTGNSECWEATYEFVSPTPANHASFIGANGTNIRIEPNPSDTTITVKAHYVFTNVVNGETGESYVTITQNGGCGCSSITNFRTYNTLGADDTFKIVCDFKLTTGCEISKVAFVLDDNSDGVVNTYGIVQNTSPSDVWIVTAVTNANTEERTKTFTYHLKYNNVDCGWLSGKTTQSFNQCAGETTSPVATADKASVPSMGTVEQRTVYVDTGSSECWDVVYSFVSPTPENHASFIGGNGTAIRINTNPGDTTITVKANYIFTNVVNGITGESYVTITQEGGCGCSSITNFNTYNTLGADDTFKIVCDFKLDSACSINKVAFNLDNNTDGIVNTYGIVQNTSPSDVWVVTASTNANTEDRTKTFTYHLKYNNVDCGWLSGKTTQSAAAPTCLCTCDKIELVATEQNTYSYLYINDELNINGKVLPFAVISAKTTDCVISNFAATTTDSRITNLQFVSHDDNRLPSLLRQKYQNYTDVYVLIGETYTSQNIFENTGTFTINISACGAKCKEAIVYYRCECGMDDCYEEFNIDGQPQIFGTYLWLHSESSTATTSTSVSNTDSVCVNRLSVMTYDEDGYEKGWETLLNGTTTGNTILPVDYEYRTEDLPTHDATSMLKNIWTENNPLNVGNGINLYTINVSVPSSGTMFPYLTAVIYQTTLGNKYVTVEDGTGRHYVDLKFRAIEKYGTEYVDYIVGGNHNKACAIREFNVRLYIAPPGYRYYKHCGLGEDNVRHCILNSVINDCNEDTTCICKTTNYADNNQAQIWEAAGWSKDIKSCSMGTTTAISMAVPAQATSVRDVIGYWTKNPLNCTDNWEIDTSRPITAETGQFLGSINFESNGYITAIISSTNNTGASRSCIIPTKLGSFTSELGRIYQTSIEPITCDDTNVNCNISRRNLTSDGASNMTIGYVTYNCDNFNKSKLSGNIDSGSFITNIYFPYGTTPAGVPVVIDYNPNSTGADRTTQISIDYDGNDITGSITIAQNA